MLPALFGSRELPQVIENKPLRNVVIRKSAIGPDVVRIDHVDSVQVRRVGYGIDGLRPGVVGGDADAARKALFEGELQAVVDRVSAGLVLSDLRKLLIGPARLFVGACRSRAGER